MRRTIRAAATRLVVVLLAALIAAPQAMAAPAPASRSADGDVAASEQRHEMKARKATKRGSVDASQLADKPAKARPQKDVPRLLPSLGGAPAARTPASGPAPLIAGPAPAFATTTANLPIVTPPYSGLAYSGAAGSTTNLQPPDPWVAVGPDHVVQVVNVAMRVTDRQGVELDQFSLATFFDLPTNPVTYNFDPRVIYDSMHGRWVVTEVSFDCAAGSGFTGHGFLDFAVSSTADPLGEWWIYWLPFEGFMPDYPAPGTSTDKLAITSNVFQLVPGPGPAGADCGPAGFAGSAIDVFNFDQLAAGSTAPDVSEHVLLEHLTARIAAQVPATSATLHGIAERAASGGVELVDHHADYLRITGAVTDDPATTVMTTNDLTAANKVGGFGNPPPPAQPGADTIANAVDGRPTDALWQNNSLVYVSTLECDPPGVEVAVRDCVRVTEVNTTGSVSKVQDFLVGLDAFDVFHGGIGLSMNGALHVTYTRSSATENPGTHAVYQLPADATNSVNPDELVRAGDGPYTIGERWGDYTGVAQDPQDPDVVWQTNEVPDADGEWITHFSPLSTAVGTTFESVAPTRVLDTRSNIGLNFRFLHRVARSWQVAGAFGIPSNAVAVTGNVTVVSQTGAGHVSITPRPTNNPVSSTINFPLGDTRANNVTIPLGPDGKLSGTYVAAAGKATHLVFDVTGYFVEAETEMTYNVVPPNRTVNTRTGGAGNRLVRNVPKTFQITGVGGVPLGAKAVTGNLTVTEQTAAGHISLTPTPHANPPTSSLNFPFGDNRANGVTIELSTGGQMSAVYKASVTGARTHLIFDVTGYYLDDLTGLHYFPLNPGRRMDTRTTVMTGLSGRFTANTSRRLDTAGHLGIPSDAEAVTGNLTVTQPTRAGHFALTGTNVSDPPTSTLNFPTGDTRANGITQPIVPAGDIWIYFKSTSGAFAHGLLDITGYFR